MTRRRSEQITSLPENTRDEERATNTGRSEQTAALPESVRVEWQTLVRVDSALMPLLNQTYTRTQKGKSFYAWICNIME